MAREWMDAPKGQFPTPFGPMDYTINSGSSVYISAGSSYDKSPAIVVNGVSYFTTTHLDFLPDEGGFGERPDRAGKIYMRVANTINGAASRAAERKATQGIAMAWNEFIFDYPDLMTIGELVEVNRSIGDLEINIEKEEKLLAEMKEDLAKLKEREADAAAEAKRYRAQGGYPTEIDWDPR